MSQVSGANIVTSGLILNVDSGNRNSMAGSGTERIGGIAAAWNAWAGMTGTSTNYSAQYSPNGVGVYLNSIVGGGVNWWNSNNGQVACVASTQYMISARVKYAGSSTTPSANLFYVRQYNSGGTQTSEAGKFSTATMTSLGNDWYLAWAYFVTDSTAASFLVQGYEYSANMTIWLEDVQCKLYGLGDLSYTHSNVSIANGTPSYTTLGGVLCQRFTAAGQRLTGTLNGTQPTSDLSIEVWVYPEAEVQADDRGCMFWLGGGSAAYMSWNKGTQQLSNYWYSHPTDGYWESGPAVNRNTWNTFTAVWNSATGYLYQWTNGVKTTSSGTTVGTAATGNSIQIGDEGGTSRQFSGGIGLIRVYNIALSDTQVIQNFTATRTRFGI